MKKLTFEELCDKLENDENLNGVIVFKQNRSWKKEYSLEERSYLVCRDNKWFKPYTLGNSLFGSCLDKKDRGVRLDWYMKDEEDPWRVDYCYIYKEKE